MKKSELRKIIKEQIKKLPEMKVTDKDGKDVTSDVIKKIEKSLEKQGYKFTKGYTSDPDLRKDDPRYTKAEITGMEDDPEDDDKMDDEDYERGWYTEALKEIATKLGYLNQK